MKTLAAGLADCGTLVFGVLVIRRDGTVYGWTEGDRDATLTIDGVSRTLLANPGFSVQSMVSTAGLSVDNTELRVMAGTEITRADILARKWDGARVYFFRYDWKTPAAGFIPVKRGSFGNFKPQLGAFAVEFRDLRQALIADSTWVLQEGCRWRLGDARCRKDLTAFTFSGAVTVATSSSLFTTSLLNADDTFGEGELTWTSGLNDALAFKVKTFAASVVTLSEAAIYEIGIGDTFTVIAGCRKRRAEDCVAKFANVLNFGGEPDKPTRDELIAPVAPPEV